MSLDSHTEAPGANIHQDHTCHHEGGDGVRCGRWGCYGFEESKAVTFWFCREHQPPEYRGLGAFELGDNQI